MVGKGAGGDRTRIEVRPDVYAEFKALIHDRKVVDVVTELICQFLSSEKLQEQVALTAGRSMFTEVGDSDSFRAGTRVEVRPAVFLDYRDFVKTWKIAEVSTALFRVFVENFEVREGVFDIVDRNNSPG